jgi:hypothetical protein
MASAAVLIAVSFAVLAVVSLWGRASLPTTSPRLLLVMPAVLLAALGMVALAWPWRDVLREVGAPALLRRHAIAAYFAGEIGKYVPGAIWPIVGRAERSRRLGVARPHAYGSVALSLGLAYLAAGTVLAATLPLAVAAGAPTGRIAWTVVIVPIGLLALHPRVLSTAARAAGTLLRRDIVLPVAPPWGRSVRLAVAYLPAWLLIGLATTAIAVAVAPDATPTVVFAAAVGSWLAGFLMVPAPGGLGVRELAFAVACGLPVATGLAVAATARLVFVTVDLVGFAVGSWVLRSVTDPSVLDDVRPELLPRDAPTLPVEGAVVP